MQITIKRFTSLAMGISAILIVIFGTSFSFAQDVARPPELGEHTKGEPAVGEVVGADETNQTVNSKVQSVQARDNESDDGDIFGNAKITELKRDNGQVYEVEIEHSLGGKQYFQENDSDGSFDASKQDLEDEPDLPKWKLGTW